MRHIEITAEMAAHIERLIPGANIADLTAFEAVALNTLPIRQRHPLYEGSVNEMSVLHAMSDRLAREQVPLYSFHDSFETPHGFVFRGSVLGNELRVQFAMDNGEEDLIRKVQNGTLAQVSVGMQAAEALCSECGWDYFGEEATFSHIFEGVCGNGHTLREGGTHVQLKGLNKWYELSLVDIGGAQGAHIVGPSAARLRDHRTKLLAAAGEPDRLPLIATVTPDISEEKDEMDNKELLEKLTAKIEEVAELKAKLNLATVGQDDAKTALEAADKRVKELEDEVAKLKANPDEKVAALEKEVTELKAKIEAGEKVGKAARDLVAKLAVMAEDSEFKAEDASDEDLVTKFGEYTDKLKKIVAGGASKAAEGDTVEQPPAGTAAFRMRR